MAILYRTSWLAKRMSREKSTASQSQPCVTSIPLASFSSEERWLVWKWYARVTWSCFLCGSTWASREDEAEIFDEKKMSKLLGIVYTYPYIFINGCFLIPFFSFTQNPAFWKKNIYLRRLKLHLHVNERPKWISIYKNIYICVNKPFKICLYWLLCCGGIDENVHYWAIQSFPKMQTVV